jgi:hypothetical protein
LLFAFDVGRIPEIEKHLRSPRHGFIDKFFAFSIKRVLFESPFLVELVEFFDLGTAGVKIFYDLIKGIF